MHFEALKYYCYLPGLILQDIVSEKDPLDILDVLVGCLEVPGKPAFLKKLPNSEKLRAIEKQAEHFYQSPTSLWFRVDPAEIVAASLWRNAPVKVRNVIFAAVKKESDLLQVVSSWLVEKDLKPYAEVPMGTKRVDLVGFKEGGWFSSDQIVSVELKNDLEQLKRGLDQMTTFADYSTQVYMACTPAMAVSYLDKHAEARGVKHWESDVLSSKLSKFGFGLLIVTGDNVDVLLPAQTLRPSSQHIKDTVAQIKGQRPL